jgi:hypothetical protein
MNRARRALVVIVAAALGGAVLFHQTRAPVRDAAPPTSTQTLPAASESAIIGWVDVPTGDIAGSDVKIAGWALAPEGIDRVEVRFAGRSYPATYGTARPDVASVKPGFPDSASPGFVFEGMLPRPEGAVNDVRESLQVVAISKRGAAKVLAARNVVLDLRDSHWRALLEGRGDAHVAPFYVVPGVSGLAFDGARELEGTYASYQSPTFRIGMRVPILYMRTTQGAAHDWQFDPDWDVERRCGARRIADDSLNGVIDHARRHRIPVLFTLNGGVWSDAACDVPAWDVNDHLERDRRNCQWSNADEVMADDALKHLPGSQESPELGRMLTYNVFASDNRRYKKRNLQAAGKLIAAFARAEPSLFIGINLDPDTLLNPFFEERQWYDYNPATLRQFRDWLAGTGPYAGGRAPVPDLRSYRREPSLTLAQVDALTGRKHRRWEDVDPPRSFAREGKPFWQDAWTHEWERFRRHLVDLHYDELSQWLADVGVDPDKIWSAQGFMAPAANVLPFAIGLDSPPKNYDTGGVSIEGSFPRRGHIGAVLYGPAARNDIAMETRDSLFATFKKLDPGWAIVEFNTADLRHPTQLPDYAAAYAMLRDAFNYGARFVSPMAWNGSNGIYAGQPGYTAYAAWRNTPLEDAMRDFAIARAYLPRGARLWPFGAAHFAASDGWTVEKGATMTSTHGALQLATSAETIVVVSPPGLAIARDEAEALIVGAADERIASVRVEARGGTSGWVPIADSGAAPPSTSQAGLVVPLKWPGAADWIEQLRIVIRLRAGASSVVLDHVALYPRARQVPTVVKTARRADHEGTAHASHRRAR